MSREPATSPQIPPDARDPRARAAHDARGELRLARRAYELGRVRYAAMAALFVTAAVGGAAYLATGPRVLAWLPLTFALWSLAAWRGGALQRGARLGLLGGAVTMVLPMSMLRPCCRAMDGAGAMHAGGTMDMGSTMAAAQDGCTMPLACFAPGAVVGVFVALLAPANLAPKWKAAAGMGLGLAAVAVSKCAVLFVGEALGLMGGLALGVTVASAARALLQRRAPASAA